MALEIRLAQPHEYAEIGAITEDAYLADDLVPDGSGYGPVLRDAARRARDAELWVAADEDGLLGTVTTCPPGSSYRELAVELEGEFRMLAVAPRARRRGAARALVQHCLDLSRNAGDKRVVLSSEARMHGAHRLYSAFGFSRLPERDWSPVPGVNLLAFVVEL